MAQVATIQPDRAREGAGIPGSKPRAGAKRNLNLINQEFTMRLFSKKTDDIRAAQQERRIPITADDHDEVTRVCASALSEAIGHVTESQMTRGGIVVHGTAVLGSGACQVMRTALESVGYVLGDDFGRNGVVVIGWDPARYSGAQMTVTRIDDRIDELLALRAQLLAAELDSPARP